MFTGAGEHYCNVRMYVFFIFFSYALGVLRVRFSRFRETDGYNNVTSAGFKLYTQRVYYSVYILTIELV